MPGVVGVAGDVALVVHRAQCHWASLTEPWNRHEYARFLRIYRNKKNGCHNNMIIEIKTVEKLKVLFYLYKLLFNNMHFSDLNNVNIFQ